MNQRLKKKLEKRDMNDLVEQLRKRQEPIDNEGTLLFIPSTYAKLDGDVASFTDPNASKVKSNTSKLSHTFKISTKTQDRAGDVVEPKGCLPHLLNYQNNPTVYFNHRSAESFPIGKSTDENGKLCVQVAEDIDAECFFHDITSEAIQVYELVDKGFLKGASIGFRPLKAKLLKATKSEGRSDVLSFDFPGFHFLEWELLEWSIVGTPCNPDATRSILSSPRIAGKQLSDNLRRYYEKFQVATNPIVTSGFVSTEVPLQGNDRDWIVNLLSEHLDEVDKKFESFESKFKLSTESNVTLTKEELEAKEIETKEKADKEAAELAIKEAEEKKKEEQEEKAKEDLLKKEAEYKLKEDLKNLVDGGIYKFAGGILTKFDDLVGPPVFGLNPDHHENNDLPHGAKVVHHLHKGLDHLSKMLDTHCKKLEAPKTKAFVEEKMAECSALCGVTAKFMKKAYPDHFGKEDEKDLEESAKIAKENEELKKKQEQEAVEKKVKEDKEQVALAKVLQLLDTAKASQDKLSDQFYKLTGKEI